MGLRVTSHHNLPSEEFMIRSRGEVTVHRTPPFHPRGHQHLSCQKAQIMLVLQKHNYKEDHSQHRKVTHTGRKVEIFKFEKALNPNTMLRTGNPPQEVHGQK